MATEPGAVTPPPDPSAHPPAAELDSLLARMTDAQRRLFKMAVVRQSIHYVSQELPLESDDDGERACLQVALDWLNDPTDKRAYDAGVGAHLDHCDGGVRHHDYPAYFWEPVWVLVSKSAGEAARCAAHGSARDKAAEACRWQLMAAAAILAGSDLPPLG